MTKALEAIETGVMVLDYLGRGLAFLYFCSMAVNVVLGVQLVKARHELLTLKEGPAIIRASK